ncbi:adenosylmethionine decarboxylase [Hydrogenibacillus schlegelii]|uniref:S-adenosylmethionine decarboxylase proenzyme n=1 Tax=Hydrogenibacillus schlegelii TaxID=1484 RepID=A0A132MRH9_HYDSH|nr:adenosylmethionine decarboxylase [Hydrogenibacillus schlegelii]MBT9252921.1 adenosylmethionine decarboxylase [Brockia lithotrophica]KWX00002.1 S-adenosylmethionine decarboxylase [Hydrogenibacillus schlegelii]MBE3563583.1 adenosylmethionine decarboxylase [Hydrogenibacillus schlegelii]MBT9283620.1 adenosylmethionine decarboxylase [Hydrogenibacillus schlegelii]OAR05076.1 S-adenosylmethionine decarboxylase proenzyme [Hydrogenibacillus schlegelii]
MTTYSTSGRHIAVDVWGVSAERLNDVEWLREQLVEAAEKSGATVLGVQSKAFEPQGATVLVMLSESHISIHTYPEHGFAAIDCYTCGETVDPERAVEHLLDVLKPKKAFGKKLIRGEGEMAVSDLSDAPVVRS